MAEVNELSMNRWYKIVQNHLDLHLADFLKTVKPQAQRVAFCNQLLATAYARKFKTARELDATIDDMLACWKMRGGPPPPKVRGKDGRMWAELTLSGEP